MAEHVFDQTRWANLDIFNQMGNIGSEVGRALSAKKLGNKERMSSAFYRGMDLMNATIEDWASQKNGRAYELMIAREQFAKSILTDDVDDTLEKYFMEFAIVARMNR